MSNIDNVPRPLVNRRVSRIHPLVTLVGEGALVSRPAPGHACLVRMLKPGPRAALILVVGAPSLLAACASTPATAVSAWGTGTTLPIPARPPLPSYSDPKDPVSYLVLGDWMLRRGRADSAAAAFFWASRLDPTLAQPYYARSVALLLVYARPHQAPFAGDVWVPVAKIPLWRLAVIDSLRREALARDPFLPPSYDHLLTGRPPFWALARVRDPAARGYWLYDFGERELADSVLGVALKKQPGRAHLRELRARAEYELGRYDSAAAQLRILLDTLSHRDSTTLGMGYSSKEMIYYALGYTHVQRADTAAARLAFESAVVENAAFYPAHLWLATLASRRGEPDVAEREMATATDIAPTDATMRLLHGVSLLENGAAGRATAELLKAIDLDPWFAKLYFYLGKAHEARGDPARAAEAYEAYASRERLNSGERVWAQSHSDSLRARSTH